MGTTTEIHDFLKLLYARIGKTISPISNEEVTRDYPEDVLQWILRLPENTKILIGAPIHIPKGRTSAEQNKIYIQQGFSKKWADKNIIELNDQPIKEEEDLIIDRVTNDSSDENQARISESLEMAFHEGKGRCKIIYLMVNPKRRKLQSTF